MGEYVTRKVIYTDDGRMIDENGYSIMMDWEKPIMEIQAKQIAEQGGDILNIGYGMGFTDYEIEKYNPKSHHIIEIHPEVQNKMLELGWYKKKHVKLYFGDWTSYLYSLPKFDGIYFDTYADDNFRLLVEYLPNILKPNGKMTFFNNPKNDTMGLKYPNNIQDLVERYFKIEFHEFKIDFIDSPYRQTGDENRCYWSPFWKTYYSPILSLK